MAPANGNGWSKLEADNYENGQFPRISLPVELMRDSYDVVVIGSGYGGGVAASRMARGRQSVCLLERGKEKWPGEYPTDLWEAAKELHVSGRFAPNDKTGKWVDQGNHQGLYHLIFGEGQNAFVGNGLGGTSLLNANVFLPANEATFRMEAWPPEITEQSLHKYYQIARKVLQPARYPEEWPKLPKYELLERQAKKRGMTCEYVEQTTRFENGLNSTGVVMQQSQLTGMDSTGVNDGSKSSTLVNYLSDAWNWGAEMFCDCEVRYIEKHPTEEGWLVFFAWQGGRRQEFQKIFHSDLMWVHARKFVFLGAGALGTTEILLRSKQKCLKMSPLVGNDMSGNGDILAFGYNTDHVTNAMGRAFPNQEYPIGPTITGIIDNRNQPNVMDDHVIEEGAIPQALARLMQPMFYTMPGKIFPAMSIGTQVSKLYSRLRSLVNPYAVAGALERTQTYLIMSHDNNQATLTLEGTQPVLRFAEVGRSDLVAKYNKFLGEITNDVGGTYVNSPFFAKLGKQEITVHPIGGANMSSDNTAASGVTNHCGQLLTGDGSKVHDGLYVVDGAVIPTALGANPFATITALAERSVAWAAESKDIAIDWTPNDPLRFWDGPQYRLPLPLDKALNDARTTIKNAKETETKGIEFSEVMEGYLHIGPDIEDFDVAEYYGKGDATLARFFLTVHAWDTDIFLHRKDHSAMLTGTFTCGAMPGRSYMVRRGRFQLFNYFSRAADTKNLTYDFDMVSACGDKLHFHGYKVVDPSVAFSVGETWKATTTLYVVITKPDKTVYARGKLHIKASDFLSELKTILPTGRSRFQKLQSGLSFLKYFTSETAGLFFAPFSQLRYPSPVMRGYGYKKKPADRKWKIWAKDDVPSWMHVWNPTKPHPEGRMRKILFIPGAAVDHQIFALPSIKENAIEYFTRKGFQCYTVTHRVGLTEVAHKGWTTYDARLDIYAALKEIRRLQDTSEPVYVVAHCAGSMALAMGLLDATIPKEWISGISASNVFMNPIPGKVNDFKARLPIAIKAYKSFVGSWFSCLTSKHDTYIQRALNQVLRFYPVGGTGMRELCQNAVCHRSELVFGRLWSHKNLNAETHASLSQFLGGTSMESLAHFTACCRSQKVLTNDDAKKPEPEPTSSIRTRANIRRNLVGIPIFFFSGTENVIFKPESTSRDLSDMLGELRNVDLGKLDSEESEVDVTPLTRSPAMSHDGDHSSDEDLPEVESNGFIKSDVGLKITEIHLNGDGSSVASGGRQGSKYDRQHLNPYRTTDRQGPMYDRRVFDGRGHLDCWMSEKSKDVWEAVLKHVERVA